MFSWFQVDPLEPRPRIRFPWILALAAAVGMIGGLAVLLLSVL